ncbi:MAG: hypothetical protein JXJ19_03790 [Elusimicrobia bacterium]|nr:hypothetical protein [Elusimicrobiota bacterium]
MRNSRLYLAAVLLFIMAGCGKSRVEVEPTIDSTGWKKQDVLLIARIDYPEIDESQERFCRNTIGDWRDFLIKIKDEYPSVPMVISVSGNIIKRLASLSAEEIKLEDTVEMPVGKLKQPQKKYLADKYGTGTAPAALINAQVKELLGYLGEDLSEHSFVKKYLENRDYTPEERKELLDFVKIKISDFSTLLKMVLDMENIGEATTSLSDAYLTLLDEDRTKVQILESMVNYKRWRGQFPDGFIPRGGYLTESAIKELEKTNIKWVVAVSTCQAGYSLTVPQVLYSDSFFFGDPDAGEFSEYLEKRIKYDEKMPGILMSGYRHAAEILESRSLTFLGFEDVVRRISGDDAPVHRLSSSTYRCAGMPDDGTFAKIKRLIGDARIMEYEYRNSGRASLDVLMDIKNRLLVAESGRIYEEIDNPEYERLFRRSLIEIYRKIGISPPLELFIPVVESDAYLPDSDIGSMLKVKCDGIAGPGEWNGSYRVRIKDGLVREFRCGFDKDNIYYLVKIPGDVSSAGVIVGHMNVGSASLAPRGLGPEIGNIQDFPLYLEVNWRRDVPEKTVIYRTNGNEEWETLTGNYDVGYSSSIVEFTLPFKYLSAQPRKKIYQKVYADGEIYPKDNFFTLTAPDFKVSRGELSYIDPAGDNYGPGDYVCFNSTGDINSNFDLRRIEVDKRHDEKVITLELSYLENYYAAPEGFSLQVIDIYIDINGRPGLGNTNLLDGRKAYTVPEDAWEYCITVNGWGKSIYNTAGRKIGEPEISVSPWDKTINIFVPDELIPASIDNWGVIPVLMAGNDRGNVINIRKSENEADEFRGRKYESDTNIIDAILPPGYQQRKILGANRNGKAVELPALRKK